MKPISALVAALVIAIDFHLANKLDVIGTRGWDTVVMNGFSLLDADKPRDPAKGAWASQTVEVMARDIRAAYDKAAGPAGVKAVIPVGEAWTRAMQAGVADTNPYDGIEAGKLNLWTYDAYHASTHGYCLEALVVFGSLTGKDPRSISSAARSLRRQR